MHLSEAKSNVISQIGLADPIVRNDEVVGSIPTSSTMFSTTYKQRFSNPGHNWTQNSRLAGLASALFLANSLTNALAEPICKKAARLRWRPSALAISTLFRGV